jgi:serine phosphatase RsbU (regulator of sigma subunit)
MDLWGGTEAVDRRFAVPGLDVHIVSSPFRDEHSGGDIYFLSMCGSGRIARLAVADVSGHGAAVAETAAELRRLMRKHINTPNQEAFARTLNASFLELSKDGTFATALLATYWAPTDHLILVNAGHPPPLLYRSADDAWTFVSPGSKGALATPSADVGVRNLPLGVIEPTGYDQIALPLETGDLVVLYTDALPEAADPAGAQLGQHGLLELVRRARPQDEPDAAAAILHALNLHRGGRRPDDDQTLVVLRHNATDPQPMGVGDYARFLGRMMGVLGPSEAVRAGH